MAYIDKITVQTISGSTTSSTEAWITLSSASNTTISALITTSSLTTNNLYIKCDDPNYNSYARLEATNTTASLITLSLPSVSGYLVTNSISTSTVSSATTIVTGITYSVANNQFEVSTVPLGEQVTYTYCSATKILSIKRKNS